MAIIDDEEKAQRLARAILTDVNLYNQDKINTGQNLTAEVDEGRRLFYARVTPELRRVFEAALFASPLALYAIDPATYASAVAAHPPVQQSFERPPLEPPLRAERVGGSNVVAILAVAVVVLVLALGAALFALAR